MDVYVVECKCFVFVFFGDVGVVGDCCDVVFDGQWCWVEVVVVDGFQDEGVDFGVFEGVGVDWFQDVVQNWQCQCYVMLFVCGVVNLVVDVVQYCVQNDGQKYVVGVVYFVFDEVGFDFCCEQQFCNCYVCCFGDEGVDLFVVVVFEFVYGYVVCYVLVCQCFGVVVQCVVSGQGMWVVFQVVVNCEVGFFDEFYVGGCKGCFGGGICVFFVFDVLYFVVCYVQVKVWFGVGFLFQLGVVWWFQILFGQVGFFVWLVLGMGVFSGGVFWLRYGFILVDVVLGWGKGDIVGFGLFVFYFVLNICIQYVVKSVLVVLLFIVVLNSFYFGCIRFLQWLGLVSRFLMVFLVVIELYWIFLFMLL